MSAAETAALGNIQLLLVDDEAFFRSTLKKRLQKRGITLVEAESGEAGLAILDVHPVHIVISDVKMPGMGGLAFLERVKADYPEIEVILLTGHATTADGVSGIKAGAFDYLTKPIEFDHLISKIQQAYSLILRREEQRREAELRERMERQMILTERLAALGTLATGVAHEINNPLAIIRESAGWMEMILAKPEMADAPRKADFEKGLDRIEKAVERARRITHQLLEFVQKPEKKASETDLAALMAESAELVRREAANHGVEIAFDRREAVAPILSDPYQLRQVMLNLITNAIHASEKNGRITLGLENAGDASVRFWVSDTGAGIPPENLEKIFEPFFTTKSPGKGTGLGLFVTRGIVARLGGAIEVDSALTRGTTFRVTLPRTLLPPAAELPSPEQKRQGMFARLTQALSKEKE
jgi:signal transduction histidine kinase